MSFNNDIAVVGIGRVGLPLALTLSASGFRTVGIDVNADLVEMVNDRKFPFSEPGYPELIKKTDLRATLDISEAAGCEHIIITVGTPLMAHIETDLSQVKRVLTALVPHIRKGHNVILRSTIAPKTTEYVHYFLEQKTGFTIGRELFLSFCPERIAEGKAMEELRTLPQIIGSEDEESARKAQSVFGKVAEVIMHTDYVSAELVKLFNNISRYIHFSVANQFFYIAEEYGAEIHDIIRMSNYKYPRGVIARPGMTAGTCLRKDFGMINETIPHTDLLLSAWKINEFTPLFLVRNIREQTPLRNRRIAVLGYTFKNDVDDTRDSLVPKLIRYIDRENPAEIVIHEPHVDRLPDEPCPNVSMEEALSGADVIFLAINHTVFRDQMDRIFEQASKEAWFVDIWDLSGNGRVFFRNPRAAGAEAAGETAGEAAAEAAGDASGKAAGKSTGNADGNAAATAKPAKSDGKSGVRQDGAAAKSAKSGGKSSVRQDGTGEKPAKSGDKADETSGKKRGR